MPGGCSSAWAPGWFAGVGPRGQAGLLRYVGPAGWPGRGRFPETFLFLRETWDFNFTCLLEIVLELSDWNVLGV